MDKPNNEICLLITEINKICGHGNWNVPIITEISDILIEILILN